MVDCLWLDEGAVPETDPSCLGNCVDALAPCGGAACGVDEVTACFETYDACVATCRL